jgi:hypothetical protein
MAVFEEFELKLFSLTFILDAGYQSYTISILHHIFFIFFWHTNLTSSNNGINK